MKKEEIIIRITEALDQIRPFLEKDGGDIRLINVRDDFKQVEIELLGTCKSCSMSIMTMKAGVEEVIKRAVPQVEQVIAVETSTDMTAN